MSLYSTRSGVTNHPETTLLQYLTDFVKRGGIVGLGSSNLFKVEERAAGANLSVDVQIGRAYLKRSANCYGVWSDAVENVTIDSNTSGNPRIDAIVLYNDLVSTPGATGAGSDVPNIIAVKGTPAASPTAPSESVIQAAIGASDPYEILGYVTVADSASSIVDANITDARRRVYIKMSAPIERIDFADPFNIDLGKSIKFEITLTADAEPNEPISMEDGDVFKIDVIQGGSGGYVLNGTWWSSIKWPSGSAPTFSTGVGKIDKFIIEKRGTDYEGAIYSIQV